MTSFYTTQDLVKRFNLTESTLRYIIGKMRVTTEEFSRKHKVGNVYVWSPKVYKRVVELVDNFLSNASDRINGDKDELERLMLDKKIIEGRYLRVNEAAKLLGISRQRVYQLIQSKWLKAIRINNLIYLPKDEVERRIKSLKI